MPLYTYSCRLCGYTWDELLPVDERDSPIAEGCQVCDPDVPSIVRHCGNLGGFRLSQKGSVGWASDGYAATYGDAEVFKARDEGRKPDVD